GVVGVSLYKAGRGRKGQVCVICVDRTLGATTRVSLGYGAFVWLCSEHASETFRRRRGGRDFVLTLHRVWSASGALTKSRDLALSAQLRRIRNASRRADRRPGSYAWPDLRDELDRRLTAGELLDDIVAELQQRHAASVARLPSLRTFRRWRADPRGPG